MDRWLTAAAPDREVQTIQDIRVGEFVRRDEGLADYIIHLQEKNITV